MKEKKFCNKLSLPGGTCTVIHERCFRMSEQKPCEYVRSYLPLLTKIGLDTPPIARKARENMLNPFKERWKKLCQNPKSGGRARVLATPLENVIRAILISELTHLGVSILDKAVSYDIWDDCTINADALATKEGYPTCIFSVKNWIGLEQIRETFAYGYLAKQRYGQKDVRLYEIGLTIYNQRAETRKLDSLISAYKPYLDGVFYLDRTPYIDQLIKELRKVYTHNK